MSNIQISYNPYTVKTEISINGKKIEDRVSPLVYTSDKRLQEWIEPKGSWPGIFKALRTSTGEASIKIEFHGTFGDFEDLAYAKEKYGDVFDNVELIHENKDTAKNADPYQKMVQLRALYKKLQDGPIDEFKTDDIKKNFDAAINSDFKIVIVAPMSSGKSTLINAILGKDLLPAVNQATTAVITEIKDNDQFDDFLVNATDKYGQKQAENKKATKKLISELNYKKDPNDPEGKDALLRLVQIEGPIPNIPSDVLNTVFVDTPGGNNSQNSEHEEMMDEAIEDENKSLILYVFNGAQLGTNDSNIILQKISNAMRNGINGKQSRDRFLFVANRMDEFDVSEEPYEEVINNTILPQLASNGITEPNLFLASAQTAKLIRMTQNGEELSETEEEDLEKLVKRFNRPTRMLSQYASLNSTDRDKLMENAKKYADAGKEADSIKIAEKNKLKAAEINSGIPAIELAINEYLEKYATAIKIKTVHDTFMKKVSERNMINNCELIWAESEDEFNKANKEVQLKQAQRDHSEKQKEFRKKVEDIRLDIDPIEAEQAEVTRKIDNLVESAKEKVKLEEAEYYMTSFRNSMEEIGYRAQVALDNAFDNGVINACRSILDEYSEYIMELDSDGIFSIGNYDIKNTESFQNFQPGKAEDLIKTENYITTRKEKVGEKTVKKKGFISAIQRVFGSEKGYKTEDITEERTYIELQKLIRDIVTEIQHSFDKEIDNAIQETETKVEQLKEETANKLEGLDEMISDQIKEIESKLSDLDKLKLRVEENKEKSKWIRDFVGEVENLLTV